MSMSTAKVGIFEAEVGISKEQGERIRSAVAWEMYSVHMAYDRSSARSCRPISSHIVSLGLYSAHMPI